jgi:flagellar motor switch protein FliM
VPEKELLTKEEMAALLDAPTDGQNREKPQRVVPYDFRRPDRLSKEQVRSIYLLHDLFSRTLSSNLPIFLRTISDVTLISVEQQSYMEYITGLPDPTSIFTLSMHPLQGVAILELNSSVAFPVIDRMLGGPGLQLREQRAVTEIEQNILEGFLKLVTEDLREAWKPFTELNLEVVGRESRPQLLKAVSPNEVVLSIVFHVQIAESRGMMSLCIPAVSLEPIIQKFNQSSYARMREASPVQTHAVLHTLSEVDFPVVAELRGTTALMDDLLSLAPGDVLRLDTPLRQPVSVSVGGVVKFLGDLVTQNNHLAVQLRPPASEADGRY